MREGTAHASAPVIPHNYDELVREYGDSIIRAKVRTMRIWNQDVDDVFQEVLMVLIRRDVIESYHQRYADRTFYGDPSSIEAMRTRPLPPPVPSM